MHQLLTLARPVERRRNLPCTEIEAGCLLPGPRSTPLPGAEIVAGCLLPGPRPTPFAAHDAGDRGHVG